jgi:chromosomal replication initiator protein
MIKTIKDSWAEILKVMKQEYDLTDISFKTWILPLTPFSVENNILKILVPEELEGLNIIQKKILSSFKGNY